MKSACSRSDSINSSCSLPDSFSLLRYSSPDSVSIKKAATILYRLRSTGSPVRYIWRIDGEEVAAQASLGGSWQGPLPEPENTLKPSETVASLSRKGVMFVTSLPGDSKSELLTYEGADGLEHWVGFHNFFVITRYNRNVMYALAVHQLGEEIALEVSRNAS